MKQKIFIKLVIAGILISIFVSSCSVLKQMVNISRLQFRLKSVSDFTINGLNISSKSSIKDFNVFDSAHMLNLIANASFPVSFNLNIEAKNPNDGSGYSRQDIDIVDFKWRLIIDDVETLSGIIGSPISVPGTGETTIFPIRVDLDLFKFFKDRGFENIINLALAIGGKNSNLQRVVLKAQPTLQTPFGKIKYPDELEIIDREFR